MAELTKEMVERRYQQVSSTPVPVNIPALPGLFFHPLTLGQRGLSSQAYSKASMMYRGQGLPSEVFLPQHLKQAVENSGFSMDVLKRKSVLYEKQAKAISEDLMGPFDQLTPTEVAELPEEAQTARAAAIEERGRRIVELLANALTPEEREELQQIQQIEALEQHLRMQTVEYAARRDQQVAELLMGAVHEDGSSYLAGTEALAAVEPQAALVDLMTAWYQFRQGMPSDFFSRS